MPIYILAPAGYDACSMAPALKERVINFTKPFRHVLRADRDDVYIGALSDLNGNVVNMFDVQPGELYTFGDLAMFPKRKEKIVACVGFVVHKIEESDVLQQIATATFYYVSLLTMGQVDFPNFTKLTGYGKLITYNFNNVSRDHYQSRFHVESLATGFTRPAGYEDLIPGRILYYAMEFDRNVYVATIIAKTDDFITLLYW